MGETAQARIMARDIEKAARDLSNKAVQVKDKADAATSNSNNNNSASNNGNNKNASTGSTSSTSATDAHATSASAVAVIDASTSPMATSSVVASNSAASAAAVSASSTTGSRSLSPSASAIASSSSQQSGSTTSSGGGLPVGAIAGIAAAVVIIALLILAFFGRRFYKKRHQRKLFGSPKGATIDDPSYGEKKTPPQMGAIAMMNGSHGQDMTPPPSSQGHGSLYGNAMEASNSPMGAHAVNGGMVATAPALQNNRASVIDPRYVGQGRGPNDADRRTSLHAAQHYLSGTGAAGAAAAGAGAAAETANGAGGAPEAANAPEQFYVVTQTYTPTMPDELDIIIGDKIKIISEYDDGWCLGVNLDDDAGVRGVFPRYCVEPVEQASTPTQTKSPVNESYLNEPTPAPNTAHASSSLNVAPAIKVSGSSHDLRPVQAPPEPFRQDSSSSIRTVQPLTINKQASAPSTTASSKTNLGNYQLPQNHLSGESYDWMASIVDQGQDKGQQLR